jgi:NADH:ubiquinone oxidoreductase subunit F (NADH-binding)
VAAPDLQTPLSRAGLAAVGASPGCGVVIALPADACGFTETVNILRWFAAETAGQCGPCVFGLPAIAAEARALSNGAGDLTRLQRWAAQVDGRGACRHPDGAVRLLRSALTVFADDINDHLHGFPCAGADGAPTIAVPR